MSHRTHTWLCTAALALTGALALTLVASCGDDTDWTGGGGTTADSGVRADAGGVPGSSCGAGTCNANAFCDNTGPTGCRCLPGYTGDGKTCTAGSETRKDAVCRLYNDAIARTVLGG